MFMGVLISISSGVSRGEGPSSMVLPPSSFWVQFDSLIFTFSLKYVGRYPPQGDDTILDLAMDLPVFIDSDLSQWDRETGQDYTNYLLKMNAYFKSEFRFSKE